MREGGLIVSETASAKAAVTQALAVPEPRFPQVAGKLSGAEADVLAYLAFPAEHWRSISLRPHGYSAEAWAQAGRQPQSYRGKSYASTIGIAV